MCQRTKILTQIVGFEGGERFLALGLPLPLAKVA